MAWKFNVVNPTWHRMLDGRLLLVFIAHCLDVNLVKGRKLLDFLRVGF